MLIKSSAIDRLLRENPELGERRFGLPSIGLRNDGEKFLMQNNERPKDKKQTHFSTLSREGIFILNPIDLSTFNHEK